MPQLSDLDLLVRHDLRLRGFAQVDELARRLGADEAEVEAILANSEAGGLVRRQRGEVGGWTLTAAGRARDERDLAAELDRSGARAVVDSAYRRFATLNDELLALCTDWQLRPTGEQPRETRLNDHTDAAYDTAVIAHLGELDDRAQPICADLAATLDRFGPYGRRLSRARRNVEEGTFDWFDRPTFDSYHSVWFELHEDLLSTLGLERGAVPAGSA